MSSRGPVWLLRGKRGPSCAVDKLRMSSWPDGAPFIYPGAAGGGVFLVSGEFLISGQGYDLGRGHCAVPGTK